jgi:cell wall assembly regulator SMI1
MSYHIMLTRKISDLKGQSQIQVQVMDTAAPQIIYFTLDELEKDELSEELKEYIRSILSQIEDGRWRYGG